MLEQLIEVLPKFGSAGLLAGALIYVVHMMLQHQASEAAVDRGEHAKEVDRILAAHKETVAIVVGAHHE